MGSLWPGECAVEEGVKTGFLTKAPRHKGGLDLPLSAPSSCLNHFFATSREKIHSARDDGEEGRIGYRAVAILFEIPTFPGFLLY